MQNILRKRLRAGEFLLGTHVNANDPTLTELMGQCGFDYLWLDTEHAAIDYATLQAHLIAARAAHCPAIVRVPWNEGYLAKRVLEMGPDGIVFPMIRSVEEARKAVAACRYPPLGDRSFGPVRAAGYGRVGCRDFACMEGPCCFLQVEHIDAVNAIDDILAVDGLDGIIFGPCDLSGSLGKLGELDGPEVTRCIDLVLHRCKERGVPAGVSLGLADARTLLRWRDRGVSFLSAGNEYAFIMQGADALIKGFGKETVS